MASGSRGNGGKKRGSLREEQKALTRQRLIEGAIDVFNEKGYQLATVDDIADAAGAGRATFYLHFKNKLEIMEAIYAELEPEVGKNFAQLDRALSGGREEVTAWVRDMFQWYDTHRVEIVALEQALAIEGTEASGLHRDYVSYMPNLAENRDDDAMLDAQIRIWLLGKMLSRLYLMWKVDGQFPEADENRMVRVVTDMWMGSVHNTGYTP